MNTRKFWFIISDCEPTTKDRKICVYGDSIEDAQEQFDQLYPNVMLDKEPYED